MSARSLSFWLFVLAVLPAHAALAQTRLPLPVAAKQADVAALVLIQSVDQQPVAGSGVGIAAYWRHRFLVQVTQVVAGKGVVTGQALQVDQHGWRLDLTEHLRCKGGVGCNWPEKPALDSALSRPPREGQVVLALLKRTADGWQLAVDRAFDVSDNAKLLPRRGPK